MWQQPHRLRAPHRKSRRHDGRPTQPRQFTCQTAYAPAAPGLAVESRMISSGVRAARVIRAAASRSSRWVLPTCCSTSSSSLARRGPARCCWPSPPQNASTGRPHFSSMFKVPIVGRSRTRWQFLVAVAGIAAHALTFQQWQCPRVLPVLAEGDAAKHEGFCRILCWSCSAYLAGGLFAGFLQRKPHKKQHATAITTMPAQTQKIVAATDPCISC